MSDDIAFRTLWSALVRQRGRQMVTLEQVLRDPGRMITNANLGIVRAQILDLQRDWLIKNQYLGASADLTQMQELLTEIQTAARMQRP